MKQRDFIFFLKFYDSTKINIYISILHKKFLKLFVQKFFKMNFYLNYSFFNQNLIFTSQDLGAFFKILSFLQFFSLTESYLKTKLKKNQIINKFNIFKTDIYEEKLLLKEEIKLKIFRKGRKKYKFKNFINESSFYLLFRNNLKKKFKFKNYLYFKNIFPNNNFLSTRFFLNFVFNFFKNYKFLLKQILLFLQLKNFLFLIFVFNYLNLTLKLFYFFFFFKCQQFIK